MQVQIVRHMGTQETAKAELVQGLEYVGSGYFSSCYRTPHGTILKVTNRYDRAYREFSRACIKHGQGNPYLPQFISVRRVLCVDDWRSMRGGDRKRDAELWVVEMESLVSLSSKRVQFNTDGRNVSQDLRDVANAIYTGGGLSKWRAVSSVLQGKPRHVVMLVAILKRLQARGCSIDWSCSDTTENVRWRDSSRNMVFTDPVSC
jgi:hypothetical protein